jgi:hypothetical protein
MPLALEFNRTGRTPQTGRCARLCLEVIGVFTRATMDCTQDCVPRPLIMIRCTSPRSPVRAARTDWTETDAMGQTFRFTSGHSLSNCKSPAFTAGWLPRAVSRNFSSTVAPSNAQSNASHAKPISTGILGKQPRPGGNHEEPAKPPVTTAKFAPA